MRITFLGTGTSQGVPIIGSKHPVCLSDDPKDKRLRVSISISWDTYNYVIDCGPDFRQQMLAHPLDRLDGILFTHEHSDHTAGLDDIRPYFFRQGDIQIYAPQQVTDSLRTRFGYIFTEKNRYPGAPSVIVNTIDDTSPFQLGTISVTPILAHHDRLPVLGYRFRDFTYLTDVKTMDDKEIDKIKGSKVLVINALREEVHHSHFNLEEALAFVRKIKPETAYFTHISHLLGFHAEVEKNLPNGIHLAYDGLVVNI